MTEGDEVFDIEIYDNEGDLVTTFEFLLKDFCLAPDYRFTESSYQITENEKSPNNSVVIQIENQSGGKVIALDTLYYLIEFDGDTLTSDDLTIPGMSIDDNRNGIGVININNNSGSLTVTGNCDDITDPDETFTIRLFSDSDRTEEIDVTEINVIDFCLAPDYRFTESSYQITENEKSPNNSVVIQIENQSGGKVIALDTLYYLIEFDGDTLTSDDLTIPGMSIDDNRNGIGVININNNSGSLTVTGNCDDISEPDETFTIRLFSDSDRTTEVDRTTVNVIDCFGPITRNTTLTSGERKAFYGQSFIFHNVNGNQTRSVPINEIRLKADNESFWFPSTDLSSFLKRNNKACKWIASDNEPAIVDNSEPNDSITFATEFNVTDINDMYFIVSTVDNKLIFKTNNDPSTERLFGSSLREGFEEVHVFPLKVKLGTNELLLQAIDTGGLALLYYDIIQVKNQSTLIRAENYILDMRYDKNFIESERDLENFNVLTPDASGRANVSFLATSDNRIKEPGVLYPDNYWDNTVSLATWEGKGIRSVNTEDGIRYDFGNYVQSVCPVGTTPISINGQVRCRPN